MRPDVVLAVLVLASLAGCAGVLPGVGPSADRADESTSAGVTPTTGQDPDAVGTGELLTDDELPDGYVRFTQSRNDTTTTDGRERLLVRAFRLADENRTDTRPMMISVVVEVYRSTGAARSAAANRTDQRAEDGPPGARNVSRTTGELPNGVAFTRFRYVQNMSAALAGSDRFEVGGQLEGLPDQRVTTAIARDGRVVYWVRTSDAAAHYPDLAERLLARLVGAG
jgi:hypothetical protein